jgi:hypothetical protein
MQVVVKGSFYRDWQLVKNKKLSLAIQDKIEEIELATNTSQISRFKKLRKYVLTYKIELRSGNKIYWMLCKVFDDKIILVRLKTELYFKKNL